MRMRAILCAIMSKASNWSESSSLFLALAAECMTCLITWLISAWPWKLPYLAWRPASISFTLVVLTAFSCG